MEKSTWISLSLWWTALIISTLPTALIRRTRTLSAPLPLFCPRAAMGESWICFCRTNDAFQRKPWELAIFAAMQGKSWQLSLGNLSSKDGRVRFLLRDLSMCSIVKIEGNELPHPSCSLHVQRNVLGGRKSIRSLKGKFSELPVSRKKCLNYIHFLTSRDNRKNKTKNPTNQKIPQINTWTVFHT